MAAFGTAAIACMSALAGAASADSPAADSPHGAHPPDLVDTLTSTSFVATLVNFVIVLTILVLAARRPLLEFLKARRKLVEQGLAEAAQRKAEAEAKQREYNERLAKLNQELERTQHDMAEAAAKDKARILEEAEHNAERLKRDTQAMLDQQLASLRLEVTREVVHKAVEAAEAIVRERIGAQDQQRIADRYLNAVRQLGPAASGASKDKPS